MQIKFNSAYIFSIKENFLSSLTLQEKKTLMIAAIAFALLANCIFVIYKRLKAKKSDTIPLKETFISKEIKQDDHGVKKDLTTKSNPTESVYEGEFLKEPPTEGQGKWKAPNGEIFEGQFSRGGLHGQGKISYPNGDIKEGLFSSLYKINQWVKGTGKVTSSNNEIHEGEFFQGKLEGQGKITYPNGEIKEGEFLRGNLKKKKEPIPSEAKQDDDVKVKETMPTLWIEEENRSLTLPSGEKEEGKFINKRLMERTITYPSSDYKNGVFSSYGSKTFFSGEGRITLDGVIYAGEFKNNDLRKGIISYPNGDFKEGEFPLRQGPTGKVPSFIGTGKITLGGDVYEGEFKDGKFLEGKITYRDGTNKEGDFKNIFDYRFI